MEHVVDLWNKIGFENVTIIRKSFLTEFPKHRLLFSHITITSEYVDTVIRYIKKKLVFSMLVK